VKPTTRPLPAPHQPAPAPGCTSRGGFESRTTSASGGGTEHGGEGERRRAACGAASVPGAAGAAGPRTRPPEARTPGSCARAVGRGNTVQQQTEWKEEAMVISSQSDAREEETPALEVSRGLLGRPPAGKLAYSLLLATRTSLQG